MTQSNSDRKFIKVLKDDFQTISFQKDVKREFRELRSFYITEEQNKRLAEMNPFRKSFRLTIWTIKSLFLYLTPLRRLLTVLGLFLLIFGNNFIVINENSTQSNNMGLLGGAFLFIVLMLELKDKLLAKDELEAGRKVQQALMPEQSPKVSGWSVWLYTRPANEVGGDLVDFLKIGDTRNGIVIGDVAGKGLHAALLMAKLQATIRAIAADYNSLSRLCTKINSIFFRDSLANIFASMLYLEIKPDNPQVRFVNAGHLPPYLIRQLPDEIKEISKSNPAIGLMKDFSYNEDVLELQKGDMIIAYSDGVTEARNEYGQFFEKERFVKVLSRIKNYTFENIGHAIINEVDYFVGDSPVVDDLSLIIIRKD